MNKNLVIGLVIVAAILAVIPFVAPNNFYLDLAIRMAINAIIALGLNLLIGFAGQISLGHAGFLGIGAYASAVLPTHFGWHPLLAMGAGAASHRRAGRPRRAADLQAQGPLPGDGDARSGYHHQHRAA